MGAAHSKRKSGRETYHRHWSDKSMRSPKGVRWTKPSVIVLALETEAVKRGAISVAPLLTYAVQCRDTVYIKPLKGGQRYVNVRPKGDRGNVFLEYAWAFYQKTGRAMSEVDIMAHVTEGKVSRWHKTLVPTRKSKKAETVLKVQNKKAVKRFFKKNKKQAESEAERMKRIGDETRRKQAEAKERQRQQAMGINAEYALIEQFKGMLSK